MTLQRGTLPAQSPDIVVGLSLQVRGPAQADARTRALTEEHPTSCDRHLNESVRVPRDNTDPRRTGPLAEDIGMAGFRVRHSSCASPTAVAR